MNDVSQRYQIALSDPRIRALNLSDGDIQVGRGSHWSTECYAIVKQLLINTGAEVNEAQAFVCPSTYAKYVGN